ncbi:MAG: branched-chain amino acid ABC transporter permease, partial [Alphaproteobacteria bacterium]|nr:branched-chain amino acid ABC transporter permease [Alphaproteobacteria bacterium]
MVLFVLACGLSVTLGLMNFVNLAHGAFAMAGGYAATILMNRWGWPFVATLPFAFLVPALIGVVLERTLYRRLYDASHLDQVLFTIGLVFMAVAGTDYLMGCQPELLHLPEGVKCRSECLETEY